MTSRTQALSPDTAPEVLAALAERWPAQVLANPITPLLLLEDPDSQVLTTARALLLRRRLVARLRRQYPSLPEWVLEDGYGYGSGYGYGYGYGYGSGYGDGYGSGDGDGDGVERK